MGGSKTYQRSEASICSHEKNITEKLSTNQ